MRNVFVFMISFSLASCGDANFLRDNRSERSEEQVDNKGNSGQRPGETPQGDDLITDEGPQTEPSEPENLEPLYDPGRRGPHTVDTYGDNLADPAYESAIIYYPTDPAARIIGASTLSGGFTNTKEQMSWLAEHLASHGVITIVFTPTNNRTLNPNVWATGHKGSFQKLISENQREGSPIKSLIDTEKIGMIGYSMGGAGTILAVNELNTAVKAAVPICAFQPATPTATIPIMLQTGTNDTVAIPGNIIAAYEAMQQNSPKSLTNFNGMNHLDVTNGGSPIQHENIAYYATAWYRVFLNGDQRYMTYLSGSEHEKKLADGVFSVATDFRLTLD